MNQPLRISRILILLLILSGSLPLMAEPPETGSSRPCVGQSDPEVLIAPLRPVSGQRIRLLVANTQQPLHALTLTQETGETLNLPLTRLGGPPWGAVAELPALKVGTYPLQVWAADAVRPCNHPFTVYPARTPVESFTRPAHADWDESHEALFALWIEHLFDAPPEQDLSFPSLEPVLRDPNRNVLHDYLGQGEDGRIPATPDCADLPYYLRAYFAWKVGLPFSYRPCSRGSARAAPVCGAAIRHDRFVGRVAQASEFKSLVRTLLDTVHSGSARTALTAESSDFYPVPLQREVLWPGTVYADPYGHVLMIAKWWPQSAEQPGILFAVDAQPDNSITRKRYWEGNFLYVHDLPGAGPGFKAFRPLNHSGQLMSNTDLAAQRGHPPYSTEQAAYDAEAFHARMSQLINPGGLEPQTALQSRLEALTEQLRTRVTSVDNGTRYRRTHPRETIPMPDGAAIFETTGTWEDYSTPSRDLRLMIALDVLSRLPDQVVIHPENFRLGTAQPELVKEELERQLQSALKDRRITYLRTDGSTWSLNLAEMYARKTRLELAYNPNDCPEIRWGASPGTEEYRSCTAQAPVEQRQRMERYRNWFREGRRPSR
ncbi:MAG: hypothetical protein ACR2HF_13010 [Methylococcaceae bacterium]